MMDRIKQVMQVAFEECCLEPSFQISSLCFAGSQGIYTMINAVAGDIRAQVCLPEEVPEPWDGKVVVWGADKTQCVHITGLIDVIQGLLR